MADYKQLTLAMVREMIADKRNRGIVPDYAISIELHHAINNALTALVAEGCLIQRSASVNRIPAYEIPEISVQPIANIKK